MENIINRFWLSNIGCGSALFLYARCMGAYGRYANGLSLYRLANYRTAANDLILSAIAKVPAGVFWRLLIGTVVMLVGGFLGEAHYIGVMPAFIIGMLGWLYILYEIFAGEASKINANQAPAGVQSAFRTMRWIVTIGWAIYPIGYFLGYLAGSDPKESQANVKYCL